MVTSTTLSPAQREQDMLGQTVVVGATFDIDGGQQLVER
jgi:hypothetical protein